jgi:hypothetical protein
MALENESGSNGFYMPVAPAYGGNGGGFGNWGGDGWWIILLFILLGGNGWGGNGGFGGGNGLYPWLNNSNQINDGFRDSMMNDTITSIRDGVFGLSTQMCNGFSNAEIAANGRQMADMNQNFALQSGIADLKFTVATENCADRAAVSDGIRDVIAAQTASTQKILDKLCDQELAAERRENANLRSELMYARGQASQVEQTARILAGQAAEIDGVYNRLKNCPVPSMPVYGNTPIFTCNGGCGCNGNTFMN